MRRLLWPAALVVTFLIGWAAASVTRYEPWTTPEIAELRETVTASSSRSRPCRRVCTRGRVSRRSGRRARAHRLRAAPPRTSDVMSTTVTDVGPRPEGRFRGGTAAAAAPSRPRRAARRLRPRRSKLRSTASTSISRRPPAGNAGEGRERWQRARQLVEDLRAMGDVGAQALMSVLAGGTDSDERRAAARLLGQLQVAQSLPLLKDIIDKDERRPAAARRRQRPATAADARVHSRHGAHPGQSARGPLRAAERGVRAGRSGPGAGRRRAEPRSSSESTADGRGRDMAFRALAALDDDRALPFMRRSWRRSRSRPTGCGRSAT